MQHRMAETRWLRLLADPSPQTRDAGLDEHTANAPGGGDQRIAWALYEAQVSPSPAASSPGTRPRRRTLAEIVSLGGDRRRWSLAFKQLQADGLVHEQTLGQVIARWSRRAEPAAAAMPVPAAPLRGATSPVPSRTAS
jgi:hypothetical protein